MPKFSRNPVNPDKGDAKPHPHPAAELPGEAVLLRIFVGADDHQKRLPLYEAIVLKAREQRLAGATVFRGLLGFGRSSRMHSGKILRLSTDLPIIIEIVDGQEKIEAFLPYLESMMRGGLVTLERAQVIRRRDNRQNPVRH
jgi:PII-like signaling protein